MINDPDLPTNKYDPTYIREQYSASGEEVPAETSVPWKLDPFRYKFEGTHNYNLFAKLYEKEKVRELDMSDLVTRNDEDLFYLTEGFENLAISQKRFYRMNVFCFLGSLGVLEAIHMRDAIGWDVKNNSVGQNEWLLLGYTMVVFWGLSLFSHALATRGNQFLEFVWRFQV